MRLTMMTTGFAPAALIERIQRSWGRHADERALMMLNDDQLRDIGLTRSQVRAAAFGLLPQSARPATPAEPQHRERRRSGRRLALAAAVAVLSASVGLAAGAAAPALDGLPTVDDLPPGTVKVSPPIPGMGEHWANPKDLPLGPIYCVMGGKVICAEFMVLQEAFVRGKSFERLRLGVDGKLPPVNHLEMTFMPHGHEGFEVPHYDVHMYFVPPEARFPKQVRQ
jgi:uncharacterized protein YjiS (DUF1127 family)